MPWDYSIYPELSGEKKEIFLLAGETLFMIQLAEDAIELCNNLAFGNSPQFTSENLYRPEKQKKTLGQLLAQLRKHARIHPKFDLILKSFLEKRNLFVHKIFTDPTQNLFDSKDNRENTKSFLLELQDDAWNVQNVFLSYLLKWAKDNKVFELLPSEMKTNAHFQQLQANSLYILLDELDMPKQDFDSIDIIYKKSKTQKK